MSDADGNMTSAPLKSGSGAETMTFNARNQLVQAGGVSYAYDAQGIRRSITNAEGLTKLVVDPNSILSRLLIKQAPDGTKTFFVYGLGLLYEADEQENTKTYHFDQVGSTIARTNDAGDVIGRAEYGVYGALLAKQGDAGDLFLYNGEMGVATEANGLLHMRARYYSPYLMRFINADPAGFSGGLNWFAFADGNPISNTDPFGLWSWNQTFGALKVVGGALEVTSGLVLGAATSWTGVGAVAGGAIALHGLDTLQAGIHQVISGEVTDTLTSQAMQSAGVSRTAANLVDTGISIAGSMGSSAVVSSISRSGGLVHLTDDAAAAAINQSQTLVGSSGIYAGPASNAAATGLQVTLRTGLNPGTYRAVRISATAARAFRPIRSIGGPWTTWQAWTGQAAAGSGTLNLTTAVLSPQGFNYGQTIFTAIDAAFVGGRIAGSLK